MSFLLTPWTAGAVDAPPTAITDAATGITTSSATLHGTVNPNGLATDAWFEWGTEPSLTSFTETTHQLVGSGIADQPISSPITTLDPWSTYYFRAVAESIDGTHKGAIRSFPTGEYLSLIHI